MATQNSPAQTGSVIEHFDRLSTNRGWSNLYATADGYNYHFHVRRDRVLELLPKQLGRVLDVGCGPGLMTEVLLERGGTFEGVDLSPEMINEAKEKFGHLPNVSFATGNIESIEAPANSHAKMIYIARIAYFKT